MKIYYDCEFLEDGSTIDPISIGMVAEDGRELYCVAEEIAAPPLYDRIRKHEWLMTNVVPHLPLKAAPGVKTYEFRPANHVIGAGFFHLDMDNNSVMPRRMIRNAVRGFVLDTPKPELWAWFGSYDHVLLAQLFGRMIDLPAGFPMWTNDIQQELHRRGNPEPPSQKAGEHHALADAKDGQLVHAWLLAGDGDAWLRDG